MKAIIISDIHSKSKLKKYNKEYLEGYYVKEIK
jgi:hypothetical protein